MKFIARKGAPDIPLELMEAQENDELVFFCGAGISYPAGLPDFRGLVEAVYQNIPETKDELEEQAIKSGFYDRALGLLEARKEKGNTTKINIVRKEIISQLKLDSRANVDTHKALLQLSKTANDNYRLVTTNVDHGFLTAEKKVFEQSDAAPKLPVPKPHKWSTVVHLHGLIDEKRDPNGEHLVFTSGDFGSAYLTERWASKFVTELFVNFTVVFVGYSINDPVIRYMTDAIAAERRQGNELFNRPYVIADAPPSRREKAIKEWEAKGVEPVLYAKGGAKHPNLHNTLQAWAAHSRDGLNSKQRIIKSKGRRRPLPPYDQDESIKQVLDTLKERLDKNHKKVTGHPAKVFSELDNPPAPIDWLPVLNNEGLLSISEINKQTKLVASNPVNSNLLHPNKITRNLWCWLLHHLEDRLLIRWVIDEGVCLHPVFKDMVNHRLAMNPPSKPYLSFWKIITSENIRCCRYRREGAEVISDLIDAPDELTFSAFSKLLEPTYNISKPFFWGDESSGEQYESEKPFSAEVEIGLSNWAFSELIESESYPIRYTKLLGPVSLSLYRAMELLAYVGDADDKDDRSHWDVVSIEPHEQNHKYKSWTCLIELCRDLWKALYDENEIEARSFLNVWKSYKFPIFRRLVLNAVTSKDVVPPEEALEYLLEEDGWWLWAPNTFRETFRLLNKIWPVVSEAMASALLRKIVEGPSREMYRVDLPDDDYQERKNRDRWLLLAKLESFGRDLFGEALHLFQELCREYPSWQLQEGERDEFTHWISTSVGNETDITEETLFALSIPERVEKLTEKERSYSEGRVDIFRFSGKERSDEVISTLNYMFTEEIWDNKIWHAGLTGLAESEDNTWSLVAQMVQDLPNSLYKEEGWAIAWWTRKAVKKVEVGREESHLWQIARRVMEAKGSDILELEGETDAIGRAINNPTGIIVETILDRLSLYELTASEGLPKPEPFSLIERALEVEGDSSILGRVILFSRLMYFYVVEPKWTHDKLIPLLDFKVCSEARYYWEGYLWNPRITVDLAIDLKELMLQALDQMKEFGRESENLVHLFTYICLQYSDLYSNKEIQRAFRNIGNDGLADAAHFMCRFLSDEEEGRDTYWKHRIKPLLRHTWPKGGEYLTPRISQELALLVLQLDDCFSEGVKSVLSMLCPIEDRFFVLNKFSETDVVEKYPEEAFQLLGKIFNNENDWNNDLLAKLVDRFVAVRPDFQDRPEFLAIREFLLIWGQE